MNITSKQRIAAAVLIVSGIAAFITPFLIHSPPTQGGPAANNDNGGGDNNTDQNTGPPGENPGGGRKTLKDLKDLMDGALCDTTTNYGQLRSLEAKYNSATNANHSTRTDHHERVMLHYLLETQAAEKHIPEDCRTGLIEVIEGLLAS